MNDTIQTEITEYISRTFPDAEVCKWVQEQFSRMSAPISQHNKIYIWHGRGGNGKSALCQLLRGAYGSNLVPVEQLLLTSNSYLQHNKAIYANRNMYICWDVDEPINMDNLKEVLNNTDTSNHFGDIHIMCNKLPQIADVDKERIHVIPFTQQFIDFPVGSHLKPTWFPHFLQRMMNMYAEHIIKNDFAATPATVVAATELLAL